MQVKEMWLVLEGKISRNRFGEKREDQFKEWENIYIQTFCVNLYTCKVRQAKAQRKCSPKGVRNYTICEKSFWRGYLKRREGPNNREKRISRTGRDLELNYFPECLPEGVLWNALQRLFFCLQHLFVDRDLNAGYHGLFPKQSPHFTKPKL